MRSPVSLVRTPVRIGRLSSEAAANTTSPSASRSTRASMLVAGASPMAATTGNSSASMPLMLDRLLPHVSFRVRSLADSTRALRWFGSDATRSVRSRAGTVISPSSVTLPGTQELIPISRLVAVSLSPELSVFSSTLASTGSVARLLTARLTVWSPRARFSCMTDTFIATSRYPRPDGLLHTVLHKNTHQPSSLVGVWTVLTKPHPDPPAGAPTGPADKAATRVDDIALDGYGRGTNRPVVWTERTHPRRAARGLSTSAR